MIETDYDYSLVYSCTEFNLPWATYRNELIWMLSRSPRLAKTKYETLKARFVEFMGNVDELTFTDHAYCGIENGIY